MERGRKPGRSLPHLPVLPVEERAAAPPGREGGVLPPTRLLPVLPLLSPVPKSSVPAQPVQISPGSRLILLDLHRYVELKYLRYRYVCLKYRNVPQVQVQVHVPQVEVDVDHPHSQPDHRRLLLPLLPASLAIFPPTLAGLVQPQQKYEGLLSSRQLSGDRGH